MFNHATYLLYTLIFTLPLIVIAWIYYWVILKKSLRIILPIVTIFTVYGSLIMTVALHVKAWAYSSEKILNFYVLGVVFEDILWWFLVLLLEVSAIIVLLKKEEEKDSLYKRN